jgi:hypothetical protein
MAKLGNEAKLVLKLANERMKAVRQSRLEKKALAGGMDMTWVSGYDRAFEDWERTLELITQELEGK